MSTNKTILVQHDSREHRFTAEVDGLMSALDYEVQEERMIFTHTFVPPALRGQGIAEKLVRAGLEHARVERLRVVPACSYVGGFIERHVEFKPLLA